ncbi:MAG TPA: class I SAM-dependent methyltransferase [Candidatus Saccharimonadales bacterium]|nr:class I SAM-dependent methyltransferase [Candidatus Saccharimonadales bacterium]
MQEDTNAETLEAYESGVADYNAVAIPEVTGSLKTWVDAGLAMLPPGAHILELGSGHGRDAKYMASRGFDVEPTDAAQAFVDYLNQNGQHARLLNALTDDYGGPYDMVYAGAVLVHFTTQETGDVLQKVKSALQPDGLFSFSVKIGEGSGWSDAKLKARRFFTYWQEKPLRELLASNGFSVVFWEEGTTGHNNGEWYHVVARREA